MLLAELFIQPFVSTRTALLYLIGGAMIYVFWQMIKLMIPKKTHKYTGPYDEEGLFHGTGKLEALNGDVYEGNFVHGYFSGQGKYLFKKNDDNTGGGSYEGQFKEGHFWGQGKETYPDGSVYEGDFVQGKRHGKGRIMYATGTSYTGDWKEGKKHGRGMIAYADGNRFEGWFVEGNRHGVGKVKDKRGKKTYAEWEYGQLIRTNVDPTLYRSSKTFSAVTATTSASASITAPPLPSSSSQPSSGRLTPRDRRPTLTAISEATEKQPDEAAPAPASDAGAAPSSSSTSAAITIEPTVGTGSAAAAAAPSASRPSNKANRKRTAGADS